MASIFRDFFAAAELVHDHSKSSLEAMVAAGHNIYGNRLHDSGRIEEAEAQYRQSLDLWRRMGNVDAIAYPIGDVGRLAFQAGRLEDAFAYLSESVGIARTIGNRVAIVDWLPHLGTVLLARGDVEQAQACYEETLALCEEIGNTAAQVNVLACLGYVTLIQGEPEQAQGYLRRSLTAYRSSIAMQSATGMAWQTLLPPEFLLCLRSMALLEVTVSAFERALTLLSAATMIGLQLPQGADLGMPARVDAALQTIRLKLTSQAFAEIWQTGQTMSPDTILAYALDTP
jgi:tetratricopeptide (TPR) repeat protein